jgi:sensor histidine kinase regulating citrate/malate metabolism
LEITNPDTLFSLDGLISLGKMIKIDGYGYGLITAKAMITTMEGSFEIKTDNSGSTRVSVYLPAGLE